MNLNYIEYENEMRAFYQRNSTYRNGRCIQIHGLPGAGLNSFVDAFICRYGDSLESEQHIYCCVIQCPKDHPKTLFIEIVQEIVAVIIRIMEKKRVSSGKQQQLKELSELIRYGDQLSQESEVELRKIEEYVKRTANLCNSFADEINIRLFIKNFDRSKKLFEHDINYAMLFKNISENYSEWLGITITIHRTLAVIALSIEAFSEFATLYDPFPIKGFHDYQMEQAFEQMEKILQFTFSQDARNQINYYCGSNPKRLEILFTAMGDLQLEMTVEQLSQVNGKKFVTQSFNQCNTQMRKHLERIMRCVDDLPGDGRNLLKETLYGGEFGENSPLRNLLFEMQILTSVDGTHSDSFTVTTIPMLADEIKQMEKKHEEEEQGAMVNKVEEQQEAFRFLHLSDLHFGFDEDEDDRELRKQYIHSFFEQLKAICRKAPLQYIFITGDIGYKAQKNDYVQAEKFLKNLLRISGLDADKLLLCPGNHDVNRTAIEDYHYPCNQREADSMLSLKKLKKHAECFQHYNLLCKNVECLPYKVGKIENYLTGVRFFEDCTVVCVNTAWFSKENNMKKIWVGKNYPVAIKNKIDEFCDAEYTRKELPVIVIMHHPSTYWEEQDCSYYNDSMNVWGMVTDMSDIVLCGHTHETSELSHMVNSARICSGGVFYQEYTYRNSFYVYELRDKKYNRIQYQWLDEKWMKSSEG